MLYDLLCILWLSSCFLTVNSYICRRQQKSLYCWICYLFFQTFRFISVPIKALKIMLEQVSMSTEDVKFFVWPDEGTFSLHFWSLSCAADLFFSHPSCYLLSVVIASERNSFDIFNVLIVFILIG